MRIGDTITAAWVPAKEHPNTWKRPTSQMGGPSATGHIVAIDGDKITLDCGGTEVDVMRSWIVEPAGGVQ